MDTTLLLLLLLAHCRLLFRCLLLSLLLLLLLLTSHDVTLGIGMFLVLSRRWRPANTAWCDVDNWSGANV